MILSVKNSQKLCINLQCWEIFPHWVKWRGLVWWGKEREENLKRTRSSGSHPWRNIGAGIIPTGVFYLFLWLLNISTQGLSEISQRWKYIQIYPRSQSSCLENTVLRPSRCSGIQNWNHRGGKRPSGWSSLTLNQHHKTLSPRTTSGHLWRPSSWKDRSVLNPSFYLDFASTGCLPRCGFVCGRITPRARDKKKKEN